MQTEKKARIHTQQASNTLQNQKIHFERYVDLLGTLAGFSGTPYH